MLSVCIVIVSLALFEYALLLGLRYRWRKPEVNNDKSAYSKSTAWDSGGNDIEVILNRSHLQENKQLFFSA